MKLIIEIDDDNYATIQEEYKEESMRENGEISNETVNIILDAFYKGTVLPKGHGRLIDENEIQYKEIWIEHQSGRTCVGWEADIDNVPTIIEADKEG